MSGRELKEWLETLDEDQLDGTIYGGMPREDGSYDALEKMSVCKTVEGERAIFLEPLPDNEFEAADESANDSSAEM